jgi:hypothetical protein
MNLLMFAQVHVVHIIKICNFSVHSYAPLWYTVAKLFIIQVC